jgi:hypothetical protein
MSDYVKTFDGAGKDANEDIVEAPEFDTEYSAIATAVATKADEVTSPTNGNLIELDSDGNLADSGVASSNLDSLTGVVQTSLDLKVGEEAVDSANFTRAGGLHVHNGKSVSSNSISLAREEDSWFTVGGVGSGADYEYSSWDNFLKDGARVVGGIILMTGKVSSGTEGNTKIYVASGDASSPTAGNNNLLLHYGIQDDGSGTIQGLTSFVLLPVSSDGLIQIYFTVSSVSLYGADFTPMFSFTD